MNNNKFFLAASPIMNPDDRHILLFDGVCNLCNRMVQFVIRHDRKKRIRFAALQSVAGQALLLQHRMDSQYTDSLVYLRRGKRYLRSSAALQLCRDLGGAYSLLALFLLVPAFIRDAVYTVVARNRYRFFGRRTSCMLPSPELRERFLDQSA